MKPKSLKDILLRTSFITAVAVVGAPNIAFAQDSADPISDVVETIAEEIIEDTNSGDQIIVTGSRIKKDTFNSIVPLQVINTDLANDQGLFNPVEILQSSSAAAGQQIDSTFQGFVLDNGPGSETIDLRGLGASRTLVLLNGRRMAPAGVEGAPSQPSINLIPRTMVDRYDLLTDGASSVYGSDAVAGVINVILKNDFDGLELDIAASLPEQSGGEEFTMGGTWGVTGDRGYIGFGAEYNKQNNMTTGDRDFLSGCETYREVTEDGEIRTVNIAAANTATQLGLSQETSECRPTRLTQRFIAGNFGSIYYQPNINNTGIAGFSESSLFSVPIDGDGDGVVDVAFANFSPNGQQARIQDIVSEQEQMSFMAVGELTLEGDMNLTPYFEALYVENKITANSGQGQLFPFVSGNNPTNPCNTLAGGVDCNAAYNAVLTSPSYLANFENYYTNSDLSGTDNCFGLADFGPGVCNPANFGLLLPAAAQTVARPVIGVAGDRNSVDVELPQSRIVAGIRGDLPSLNFGEFKDWSFDISAVHSWSDGESSRSGIRDDRLNFALGNDIDSGAPVGNAPCDPVIGASLAPSVTDGCVAVDLFAPSLYTTAAGGDFATAAERDYLFDSRDFDTHYSQTIIDGIVQGDLFTLPGGDVSLLLGAQYRKDEINSQPDDIARDGLFFGFFSDGGAVGERDVKELYAETFIPLGTGQPFFREFNVELAGRLTDDEFYGTNETYSVKAGYRPVDSLLLRTTYGTSFRAPNLRELFLAGQSGFGTLFDPCAVPDGAFNALTQTYDASQDTRSQTTLNNCIADGLDPTSFLAGQFDAYSVEVEAGGSLELDPETSTSFTAGFSFDQPFTDAFDFEFGATYYDIDIENTIIEPSAAFIINDCYTGQPNQGSAFCSRIQRDFNDVNNPGVIDLVDAGFINRNRETAKGIDFSIDAGVDDILIGSRSFDIGFQSRMNRLLERKTIDLLDDVLDEEEFRGEFGFGEWRGFNSLWVNHDKWRATWSTQVVSSVEVDQEDLGVTDFTNFNDGGVVTCAGPDAGDVNCRPVYYADDYFLHSASVRYREDSWSVLVGVNNVFDKKPPLVDPSEVFSVSNVPIGSGYDIFGREFFVRATKTF